ncbi:MAG: cobalt-precorrin hydrolase [Methanobacterium sp.]|jgi:cobalt-precorrin 5A hydrolase|uniref:cobalt-precorrin 5A hydrolase n=1 Tax=Methanobacterium sp. TaxID=2164 RepID=UPI0003C9CCDA|nr:cobalt-precorrin 5A hydrolase [Methanobacterium sp.]MDI3550773.1 cobalt-precorrin hydrolase [Methanobacterium sp.]CDG66104.1 cobalamin (vitamin B12) biosynthesis protein CbiG [Methanobacterium sp. MB1]
MKIAIISVTEEGKKIAKDLELNLKNDPTVLKVDLFHKNVEKTFRESFDDYDCWIAIMAAGIVVRTLCPYIKSKLSDPSVLVISENRKHVISLLSGHLGGGNQLSIKIAGIIGAIPVITTSTDLKGRIGIDSIARQYYLDIKQPKLIKEVNQLIAEDTRVDLYIPSSFRFLENHPLVGMSYKLQVWDESFLRAIIPQKLNTSEESKQSTEKALDLYPRLLVAGLGSKKGITGDQVFFALRSALQHLHIPLERLDMLATAEVKKNETGILETATKTDLPINIVTLQEITHFEHPDCTPSPLVQHEFGVQGVCEPASLITAGSGSHLILRKIAYNGVTVAIAVSPNGD